MPLGSIKRIGSSWSRGQSAGHHSYARVTAKIIANMQTYLGVEEPGAASDNRHNNN